MDSPLSQVARCVCTVHVALLDWAQGRIYSRGYKKVSVPFALNVRATEMNVSVLFPYFLLSSIARTRKRLNSVLFPFFFFFASRRTSRG